MNKILIYGAPGSGKTTLSLELQKKFHYPLVEADFLREVVAQKEKTREEDPFVWVGTKEAYREFGKLTEENVTKGLRAVRNSMAPYVENEMAKYPDKLIMEAAFLNPALVAPHGKLILVVTPDEKKHYSQYFKHREHSDLQEEIFRAVRIIQDYLIREAKEYQVVVVENDGDVEQLASRLDL
ncbi:MAG: AAA family ATPase [Patescibacteria group bacterium]